jgi:hypothetical protein
MSRAVLVVLIVSVCIVADAHAVTMAWSHVGNPDNPADAAVLAVGAIGLAAVLRRGRVRRSIQQRH